MYYCLLYSPSLLCVVREIRVSFFSGVIIPLWASIVLIVILSLCKLGGQGRWVPPQGWTAGIVLRPYSKYLRVFTCFSWQFWGEVLAFTEPLLFPLKNQREAASLQTSLNNLNS